MSIVRRNFCLRHYRVRPTQSPCQSCLELVGAPIGRFVEKPLRRKKNLTRVRIFHFGSGRKSADIDITGVGRERTGNQSLLAGHRSSVKQAALSFFRSRGSFRRTDIVPIRRRRDWAARSLAIRSIARRRFIISFTTVPVRPRLRLRVHGRAAKRSEKVSEGPRFGRLSRSEQSEDRQPDDNCSERPFQNNYEYWPHPLKNTSPPTVDFSVNPSFGPSTLDSGRLLTAGIQCPSGSIIR